MNALYICFQREISNTRQTRILFLWAWCVLRAVDDNRLVALLAILGTSLAKSVELNPPLAVDEQAHFESTLLAHSWHDLTLLKKCGYRCRFRGFFRL